MTTTNLEFTAGIHTDMPGERYFADPVPGGSLSQTGAKSILSSPARYQYDRTHRVEKAAYDVGHAVHTLVLGTGMPIAVLDFDSWRTNAVKDASAAARTEGKVPLLTKEYEPIKASAEAVLAHPLARRVLEQPGQAESSLFAQDPETGVWLRSRLDVMPDPGPSRTILADLKTSQSADPNEFRRSAANYGYDTQAEWYQQMVRMVRGDDETAFVFVVVEVAPPHLVSVVELGGEFPAIGRRKMRRAIQLFKQCTESGEWPGFAEVVHLVEPEAWYSMQSDLIPEPDKESA